jgi:hypothetical protein
MKKAVVFLALVIAGGVAKAGAEEVTGTILFPPEESLFGGKPRYTYYLDTTGNKMMDMTFTMSHFVTGPEITNILKLYLTIGTKVTIELKNTTDKKSSSPRMLVGITTADGLNLDFIEMFSIDGVKYYFPFLYEKLVREGRAR